jgi:hypothetical protein
MKTYTRESKRDCAKDLRWARKDLVCRAGSIDHNYPSHIGFNRVNYANAIGARIPRSLRWMVRGYEL